MLKDHLAGHHDIEKTIRRAKTAIYWPNIDTSSHRQDMPNNAKIVQYAKRENNFKSHQNLPFEMVYSALAKIVFSYIDYFEFKILQETQRSLI